MPRRFTVALAAFAVALVAVLVRLAPAADDHPVPPPLKEKPPTSFECRWADAPPVIDGKPDDAAWKHAQVIDTFHLAWLGDQARLSRTATRARLLWDRTNLYFFADMDDGDLFADVKDHDGNTWNNDVFEMFLRPDDTKPGYYEFQVNAAGTKFDCFFPKRDAGNFEQQKKAHDFHITSKVILRGTLNKREDKDSGWSVEGSIPWTDFLMTGGRPTIGEKWRLNLCRYDYHKDWPKPELSSISPIAKPTVGSFFHQYEDYTTLTFVGPDGDAAGKPFGMTERPPVTTSTVAGFPDPQVPYRITRAYPNFKPGYPVNVRHVPGTHQMLLLTQPRSYAATTLWRFPDDPAVTDKELVKVMETPDGGTAYDIAFHPKFKENGYVYIGWSGKKPNAEPKPPLGKGKMARITRYTMKPTAPYDFDVNSAAPVVEWDSDGHNGAAVCFGVDGMMYVTTGDGTSDSDTNETGQAIETLLSKVLRLDVDNPAPGKMYSVPKDNPFVGDKRYAPETWAYGFRNPWRIASDPPTGQLWVGQNGQDLWEQAYLVTKGANYGWSVTEGGHPFYPERKAGPDPIQKPTCEHSHAEARSLTGGYVYRGSKLPGLVGAYLYGDYSTGRIWGMKHDGKKPEWHQELANTPMKITAFSADGRGELVICDHGKEGEGGFFTLEAVPPAPPSTFPTTLSASGLFDSVKDHKLKPGVVPYSVNAPFWSDGLYKERYVALPPGGGITHRGRGWDFPAKTVLVKSFASEGVEGDAATRKWVETRFLTKQGDEWYGYSYVWNDAGTDATLVGPLGMDKELTTRTANGEERKLKWHYPGRAECMVCHSRAQNFVLGLCDPQMNKDHDYGGRVDNQIRVFDRLGMFEDNWLTTAKARPAAAAKSKKLTGEEADAYVAAHLPQPGQREPNPGRFLPKPWDQVVTAKMVNPYDATQDLAARARSFLHANCAGCHVEAGGGNAQMELGFNTALDKMRLLNEKPVHQTFNLPDAKLVVPGDPDRSVLIHRLGLRGATGQMPPLSSARVDEPGLALMREWVKSLKKE